MNSLQGKCILVTRPAAQAGELVRMIAAEGGRALRFPLLEIGPADDPEPLQQAIARLADYAMAIFISPNAVAFSLPQILAAGHWPDTLQAAAIGQGSAAQLAIHGIGPVIAPADRFDSEALLELTAFQADAVAGKTVLILRGNGGRELLAETLRERGAQVDAVTCYHRSLPVDAAPILSLLRNKQIDALTISSSEGLRNLLALLDTDGCQQLRRLPLFVPHQRIAEVAAELGLQRIVLTAPADAGIIESLCTYNWLHHE
ncbi:uroporphyrinogen-III synthase [Propionivibrio sp.]|uniref:uroporphyrinogen-III synthase n=1 Tax=Propionivibrio sp. TaxID=2212460 RepID=UPI00262754ED|nr:uroporphyrinogen-III synthase [Propionivibrio sp.]